MHCHLDFQHVTAYWLEMLIWFQRVYVGQSCEKKSILWTGDTLELLYFTHFCPTSNPLCGKYTESQNDLDTFVISLKNVIYFGCNQEQNWASFVWNGRILYLMQLLELIEWDCVGVANFVSCIGNTKGTMVCIFCSRNIFTIIIGS